VAWRGGEIKVKRCICFAEDEPQDRRNISPRATVRKAIKVGDKPPEGLQTLKEKKPEKALKKTYRESEKGRKAEEGKEKKKNRSYSLKGV